MASEQFVVRMAHRVRGRLSLEGLFELDDAHLATAFLKPQNNPEAIPVERGLHTIQMAFVVARATISTRRFNWRPVDRPIRPASGWPAVVSPNASILGIGKVRSAPASQAATASASRRDKSQL